MKLLLTLALVSSLWSLASGTVLIIHEQRIADDWALGITWLDDASQIGDAVVEIDAAPDKRRGPSFVVLGGIRLDVDTIETPGPETWEASAEQAGSYVIFWNATNSNNPADWHAEIFPDQPTAEAFVNDVKADSTRELWDERPLKIEQTWKPVPGEPLVRWVLIP